MNAGCGIPTFYHVRGPFYQKFNTLCEIFRPNEPRKLELRDIAPQFLESLYAFIVFLVLLGGTISSFQIAAIIHFVNLGDWTASI